MNASVYLVFLIFYTIIFLLRGFVGPVTQSFDARLTELISLLDGFWGAPPFTLRRLLELLSDNSGQYLSTHKYMNGLERILSVTSTL
jgi:hypothetical protein